MEANNDLQIIDPKMAPVYWTEESLRKHWTEESLRKQRRELMEANNDLQIIDPKMAPVNNIYVDPDMIPFNDLQMTPEQHLALKLLIRYNSSVEDALAKAKEFFEKAGIDPKM